MSLSKKAQQKVKKSTVVICISGLAGSGKSTLARRLAEKYKLDYVSGGDALRALAAEEGYRNPRCGWWESNEGLRFLDERTEDNTFDEAVDRRLVRMASKGNVVLDSWTMPWLLKHAFKMWLEASPEKRAKRISQRDRISYVDALTALKRKEKKTKAIYKKLYGFNLGEDFAPFDFILDTNNLRSHQVFRIACMVMENVVLNTAFSNLGT